MRCVNRTSCIANLATALLASLLGACIHVETTVEQTTAAEASVVFDVAVPQAPSAMAMYALEVVQPGGRTEFRLKNCRDEDTKKVVEFKRAQTAQLAQAPLRALPPGPLERCPADPTASGDVDQYVDFASLTKRSNDAQLRTLKAQPQVPFDKSRLELEDDILGTDSRFEIDKARVLRHARVLRDSSTGNAGPEPVLMYVSARRHMKGYRVDGPGSRATLMMDASGADLGYSRSWKKTSVAKEVQAPDTEFVRAEIKRQLQATGARTGVHVQQIELAYYDGGGKVLQPVYRYIAEFNREPGMLGKTEHVVGYVPLAAAADEPVPQVGAEKYPNTAAIPSGNAAVPAEAAAAPRAVDPIRIGIYIARDDNQGWITDATEFWESLSSTARNRFVIDHRVRARPEHFTSRAHDFVDSCDIALVEAHGSPRRFATAGNSEDLVIIGEGSFPASGYGPTGKGRLKHWLLHSCEVVLGPNETSRWAEGWWSAFGNGMYSVVGYRTSMYINDGVGAAVGRRLAAGEPVLSAWFSAVASMNVYGLNPSAMSRCGGSEPMGRPSAITACGTEMARAGDTVTPTPDCLDAWWIDDAAVTLRESVPN